MNEKAHQARLQFEKEWKHAGELIDKDRKGMVHEKQALSQAAQLMANKGTLSQDEEAKVKQRIARGAWNIGKDKAALTLSQDKVEAYEAAFSKIQAATGIQNIDELVDKFIKAEDKNFAMFSHVNKLAAEADHMEQSIGDIRAEIEKYKGKTNSTENQRKRILKDLEAKLEKAEHKADHYDSKYKEAMSVVTLLKKGVETLFTQIGCYTEGFAEMLGNQGVTDSNIMQYLGIIEQRTNEILQMYHAAKKTGSAKQVRLLMTEEEEVKDPSKILANGPKVHVTTKSLDVRPPGVEFFAEDSNTNFDERPLPLGELQRGSKSKLKGQQFQRKRAGGATM